MSKRSSISLNVKLRVIQRCVQNESNPNYEACPPTSMDELLDAQKRNPLSSCN